MSETQVSYKKEKRVFFYRRYLLQLFDIYVLSREWTEELTDSITYLLHDNFLFRVNVSCKSIIL